MTELDLITLNATQAQSHIEELVATYLDVYAGTNDPFFSEDRYRKQLDNHLRTPSWQAVCGYKNDVLVGYIYGFCLSKTTAWWNGLLTEVPPGFTDETGDRTFAISELLVRREHQRQGIASTLHRAILNGRTEERATLLVEPDNTAAQSAYVKWGWQKVSRLRPDWGDTPAPTFDVFVLPLRR